jgi:uncharacterized HAD superfamily protein
MNEIAKEFYEKYIETAESELFQDANYAKDAKNVYDILKTVKELMPPDQNKLIQQLESSINTREFLFCRASYIYAFKQGAKMMLEVAMTECE